MYFEPSEEQIMIRQAARDFAHKELLPGVIERDEQTRAIMIDTEKLRPDSRVGNSVRRKVIDRRCRAALRINEVKLVVRHPGCECPQPTIARNQPNVDCARRIRGIADHNFPDDRPLLEIPDTDAPAQHSFAPALYQ